jgi:hypothetical protein
MAFDLAAFEREALENGIAHYFDPATGQNTFDLFTGGGGGYYDVTGGPTGLKLYNWTGGPVPAELQSLADKYMTASPEAVAAAMDPNGPGNNQGPSDLMGVLSVLGPVLGVAGLTGGLGGLGLGDASWGANAIGESGGATGAFDMGGSAGVFDSFGNPLYSSPAWTPDASTYWTDTTTAGTTPSSAISKILNGTATADDWMKAVGAVAPSLLGAVGASQQTDAMKDLAGQFAGYGAPYRSKLADLYANPSSFLSSPEVQVPVQQGTDALARSLSAKVGNPIGNPTALSEIQNYASNQLFGRLGQEKDRLAGFGGLSAYNQAAPGAAAGAAGSEGNIFNALGYGLGNLLSPQTSLESLLKQLQGSNIFKVT